MPLPLPSSGPEPSGPPSPRSRRPASSLPQPPPSAASSAPPRGPSGAPPSAPAGQATCYRHPDRPTGRRCTRCGKPACGECLVAASVGSHCLECAKADRPDVRTRARFWSAGQPALVAYVFIAINVAVFIGLGLYFDLGGMLSGRLTEAHFDFGLNEIFVGGTPDLAVERELTSGHEYYRLVTSGFLHFGLIHLGMNMFFLFILGNEMEPMIGRFQFAAVYIASLLGGSAGVILLDGGGISAGASGAVFGLLGAYAVGIWRHGINVFNTNIGTLLLINLFLTFTIRNISIGGHIGGLVAGAICGFVVMAPGYKGIPMWVKLTTPVVVAVVSVAVAVLAAGA